MDRMTLLRDLWQAVFPAARSAGAPEASWSDAPVGWVRILRARVPAFDAVEAGDLAIIPSGALRVVAPAAPEVEALVDGLARAGVAAILLLEAEPAPATAPPPAGPGPAGPAAAVEAAARRGLAAFRLPGAEAAAIERSVIGYLVNRQAELDRRAGGLEEALERVALHGGDLEAIVAAVATFLGRAVALEGRRGEALALHAPAGRPSAAAAVAAYLARPRPVALRVPIPAAPSPGAAGGAPAAGPAGSLALLGDEPPTELERVATARIVAFLALELERDAGVRRAHDAARQAQPLPPDGPPWAVLVARQPRDGVSLEEREEARREIRLLGSPRRLALRGDAESLELRCVVAADAGDPSGLGLADRIAGLMGRSVAVSGTFAAPEGRPVAEAEARATLEAVERLPDPPRVARSDRLPAYRLLGALHNLPEGTAQARDLLAPLLSGRPAQRHERLATLRAVLDQPGLGEAAAILGVHRNTVAYRVRAIERLTGWRLADPELRLPLAIALRLVFE